MAEYTEGMEPATPSGDAFFERPLTRSAVVKKGMVGIGLVALGGRVPAAVAAPQRVRRRSAQRIVTIVRGADIGTFDYRKTQGANDAAMIRNIAEPIIRSSHNNASDIRPWLATSWKAVKPTRWRLQLRRGVKFSDGTPFNADVAAWSLGQLVNPKLDLNAKLLLGIASVHAVDKYTLDIVTTYPTASIPAELQAAGLMLDRQWTLSSDYSPDKLVGTGPGVLKEWAKGQEIVLTSNPHWWNGKLTYDASVWKPISDPETRANAAATGAADIVLDILPQDVSRLRKVKGLHLAILPTSRTAEIRIQDNVAPFNKKLVRQALNYAVDVPAIIKNVFQGYGKQENAQIIGSFAEGWQKDLKAYPYDPNKAKDLLRQAGYAKGFKTTIGTPSGLDPNDLQFAQAVSGYLKAVGIDAEVVIHEIGEYQAMFGGLKPADPLFYASSGNIIPTTVNELATWLSPRSFAVHDTKLANWYVELQRAVDPAARAKLERQIHLYIRDYAPAIFGYQIEGIAAVSNRVSWSPRSYLEFVYMDEIKYHG